MPLIRNTNTTMTDTGSKTGNNSWVRNGYTANNNLGAYGTQYNGASSSAGTTGSKLGLYGSGYAGASAKPASTTTPTASDAPKATREDIMNKLRNALGDNIIHGTSKLHNNQEEPDSGTPRYYGGGGGTADGGSYSADYSSNARADTNNYLEMIQKILKEQYDRGEELYKTQYDEAERQRQEDLKDSNRKANRDYFNTQSYIRRLYGDSPSGTGLSNMTYARSRWNNNIASNERTSASAKAQNLANYQANRANNNASYAQYSNQYVLPVYQNREMNEDDIRARLQMLQMGLL